LHLSHILIVMWIQVHGTNNSTKRDYLHSVSFNEYSNKMTNLPKHVTNTHLICHLR